MQGDRNEIMLALSRLTVQFKVPIIGTGEGRFDVWIIWLPIFFDQLVNKTNWRTDHGCTEKGGRAGYCQCIRVE